MHMMTNTINILPSEQIIIINVIVLADHSHPPESSRLPPAAIATGQHFLPAILWLDHLFPLSLALK